MKKYIKLIILIIICIIISCVVYFNRYYKIEDRTKAIKNIKETKPVGWLRVQGTNIDMPVMYYYDVNVSDPSYDMAWSYSKKNNLRNMVILSHNIQNVSSKPLVADKNHVRFEQLMSFIYYDFVKENKYIEYSTNKKNYLYKIFGVTLKNDSTFDYEGSNSKTDVEKILTENNDTFFKFDVDVNKNDKLLTLATCTRFNGKKNYSFVVLARRIRKGEIVKNYNVVKTKKYRKIEKVLKGDG